MVPAAKGKALVAIDLGAQSCRVSLLRWGRNQPVIRIVHRFENSPVSARGRLSWDVQAIFEGVKKGLRRCAEIAREGIASIGVDGWAVDYVRLDALGDPAEPPFCYRDVRTEISEDRVHAILPPSRLYSMTGIQILRINTLYQLYSDHIAGSDCSLPWLNLPEYIAYRLSGKRVSEYTNATHTGLVALGTHSWCRQIFRELGLDPAAAPEIVPTGSLLGSLRGDLSAMPGLEDTKVIVPACHDTASAVAAIPAVGNDWAFISSGTWSLVGTVLDYPCTSDEAQHLNFTNLGGVGGKSYFLKNVNGLWLLQQCLVEWQSRGVHYAIEDLIEKCSALSVPVATIDVDDPQLMVPGNTIEKINRQLRALGHPSFSSDCSSIVPLANLIFHSMAERYADALASIEKTTAKKLKRLFIVGGGSQNRLLNRLTAQRTGLEVTAGATESATIGNFAIQAAVFDEDWTPALGVTEESVAKWAELFSQQACARSDSGENRASRLLSSRSRHGMEAYDEEWASRSCMDGFGQTKC
jgi:rhamnulokinase